MGKLLVLSSLLLAVAFAEAAPAAGPDEQSTYIVHVSAASAPRSTHPLLLGRAYASFLRGVLPAHLHRPSPSVLYSYAHAATGFAARLTEAQAEHLAAQHSVLAVVPDQTHHLHTTLSPSFLRLSASAGLVPASNAGTGAVIGLLDTGIYPKDRASFAAEPSLPPPPRKFRGRCVSSSSFNASEYCNNKLVGAKFFYKGYEAAIGQPIDETKESKSPLDTQGHGTHTASTAAGAAVTNASFYNYGRGTAVGMASRARIATYKVCWKGGCTDTDILAAIDEAVADRVDVISMSLGATGRAPNFYEDATAIGSFGAVRKGIVVSCSAGNSGPDEFTAVNVAPWILTVGASTINRRFPADVVLGNGNTFIGTSLYAGKPLGPTKLPLVYAGSAGSTICEVGKLNTTLVAGKIVLCDPGVLGGAEKGLAVKLAGGAGAIIATTEPRGELVLATAHVLPATTVTFAAAGKIQKYATTQRSPTATIRFHGTVVGPSPSSPRVASFSSRGPNYRAHEVLKPDVTAPGVDILAAWTGEASPTGLDQDTRRVKFNIISGTSMSCPHVSGIASMLQQARPGWSPAAIKSALMTTAYNVDNAGNVIIDMSTGKASTPFMRGAGHVDPNSALDPGLVYDAGTGDYISFLCALGYTANQIAIFTRDGSVTNCSTHKAAVGDLNYPAFSAVFASYKDVVTQRRVVHNVGKNVNAVYVARVTSPAGVRVTVNPSKLVFDAKHRTRAYEITFAAATAKATAKYAFGSVVWSDGEHRVTSPLAITWPAGLVSSV